MKYLLFIFILLLFNGCNKKEDNVQVTKTDPNVKYLDTSTKHQQQETQNNEIQKKQIQKEITLKLIKIEATGLDDGSGYYYFELTNISDDKLTDIEYDITFYDAKNNFLDKSIMGMDFTNLGPGKSDIKRVSSRNAKSSEIKKIKLNPKFFVRNDGYNHVSEIENATNIISNKFNVNVSY